MSDLIVTTSAYPFAETVDRLAAAIHAAGATLFATIDQRAAAEGAGLSLRPTTLLLFGNPKGGTPLMDAFPQIAIDLPLRILIWEDGEAVKVGYISMTEIAVRYGVSGKDALVAGLDHALATFAASVHS